MRPVTKFLSATKLTRWPRASRFPSVKTTSWGCCEDKRRENRMQCLEFLWQKVWEGCERQTTTMHLLWDTKINVDSFFTLLSWHLKWKPSLCTRGWCEREENYSCISHLKQILKSECDGDLCLNPVLSLYIYAAISQRNSNIHLS